MNKCRWCNSDCINDFYGPECEEKYKKFEKYAERYGLFSVLTILPLFLLLIIVFLNSP